MKSTLILGILGSLFVSLGGCGSRPVPPPDEPPENSCTPLTLSQTQIYRFTDAHFSVQANVSPEISGAYQTQAVLEVYDEWSMPNLPPLTTGTFDLGASPNEKYGTCQHCVTMITPDSSEIPKRTFFQTKGSIELTKLDPDDPTIAAGKISNVELTEVVQKADGSWVRLAEGECYSISSWSFDTTPVNDIPCEKAEDCANTARQVCSPKTNTCSPLECLFTFDVVCPQGETCVAQVPSENSIGACYQSCSPNASGDCPADMECLAIDPVQNYGICRPTGKGAPGSPCSGQDVSTGCTAGNVCAGVPATCQQTCDYLTKDPGCPAGLLCSISNVCLPPTNGDGAKLGETCAQSWVPFRACGGDADAFRGLCFSLYPEDEFETCFHVCRMADPDCPSGEYCAGIFSNMNVGICWKTPVCGDGELDPLNEVCDDGNAMSGDGCSSDCKVAEFDALCKVADKLLLDTPMNDSTFSAPTGYGGSCELYIVVPSKTYSFDVPGPGRLSLEMTSSADLDLVVVGNCADPNGTELACKSTAEATEQVDVDFAMKPVDPAMIIVRGRTMNDVGSYELRASFTPAVCGDGIAVGPEVCDDGNTMSGQGFCSADCLTADWPAICGNLPMLSTSAPNVGDTSKAPNVNNADEFCTFGTGGEVMYRYVAPKNGTLKLHVDETNANYSLYVLDSCGPATEPGLLACANFGWPPSSVEDLSVALTANKEVLVVIDTVKTSKGGAYSLSATFE